MTLAPHTLHPGRKAPYYDVGTNPVSYFPTGQQAVLFYETLLAVVSYGLMFLLFSGEWDNRVCRYPYMNEINSLFRAGVAGSWEPETDHKILFIFTHIVTGICGHGYNKLESAG